MIQIYNKISDWAKVRERVASETALGFVPTMGALHEGHLSLIRRSVEENSKTLVSIFINPTQFNDPNDFANYPISLDQDISLLSAFPNVFLLLPQYEELYPDHFTFQIHENSLSKILCGETRPGHFTGVLTVVMKLLQISQAHNAYFGEKDFQQYVLVREMTKSFFLPTKIIPCPIVREIDGLAMSSRNRNLTSQEREMAPRFFQILNKKNSIPQIRKELTCAGFRVDYVEEKWGRKMAAVFLGETRLIDNVPLGTSNNDLLLQKHALVCDFERISQKVLSVAL